MDPESRALVDPRDGAVYKTITIGKQVWMAENLKAKSYRNGDSIPLINENDRWGEVQEGACCFYNNDPTNNDTYGLLYNWFAVNDMRGLAPEGWRIPSDTDWKELEMYLGMQKSVVSRTGWRGQGEGCTLKEPGTTHWHVPNDCATNESGFSALPGGYRDVEGLFYVIGYAGYWWSNSEHQSYFAWYRSLYHTSNKVHRTTSYEGDGFSVRCLKDL